MVNYPKYFSRKINFENIEQELDDIGIIAARTSWNIIFIEELESYRSKWSSFCLLNEQSLSYAYYDKKKWIVVFHFWVTMLILHRVHYAHHQTIQFNRVMHWIFIHSKGFCSAENWIVLPFWEAKATFILIRISEQKNLRCLLILTIFFVCDTLQCIFVVTCIIKRNWNYLLFLV